MELGKKIKISAFFCITVAVLLFPILSYSHSGRTDSSGGHYNRKTGSYHYHNSGRSTYKKTSTSPSSGTVPSGGDVDKNQEQATSSSSGIINSPEKKQYPVSHGRDKYEDYDDIYNNYFLPYAKTNPGAWKEISNGDPVEEAYRIGKKIKSRFLDNETINRAKSKLKEQPSNPDLHFALAEAYENENMLAEAIRAYMISVELGPDKTETYGRIALIQAKLGNTDKALDILASAIQKNPESSILYFDLSRIQFKMNQFNAAEESILKAIKISPDIPEYRYHLGRTYLEQKKLTLALKEYETLKGLDEKMADELFEVIYK